MATTTYNLKQKIEAINTSKNEIKSAIEDKIEASIGESYEILGNIQTYANEIGKIVTPNNQTLPTITENGTYEYNVDTYTGLDNVTVNVNQSVQDKTITENGTYNASVGYIGLGEVTVDVQPPLITKNITKSGIYNANDEGIYGYEKVVVDVDESNTFLIEVIDYDGTILKFERLSQGDIFELPQPPTHTGLVFQGWSSPITINNDTITVTDTDVVIGAIYTTASGLNEFDVTLNSITGLTVTFNIDGTKDWGDGTTNTATSHTYSNAGYYTITCDGTTITSSDNSGILGQNSSSKNYYLTNIRLATIETISAYAFNNCCSLKSVLLSNSVEEIKNNAFDNCGSIKIIILPNSNIDIDYYAFKSCSSIKNFIIPDNISNLNEDGAIGGFLSGCSSLEKLIIPDGVTKIRSFSGCSCLTYITIPNSATSIDANAFNSCYALRNIKIPTEITFINGGAFYDCYSLESITIPIGVTSILASTFVGCKNLKNILIPSNVTTINGNAFSDCGLENITMLEGVSSIGYQSFNHCTKLTSIKFPKSINSIGSYAFAYCTSLVEYDFTNHTSVPTLSNADAFSNINPICKIKVPLSLENAWKTATNWSTYADYIVGV